MEIETFKIFIVLTPMFLIMGLLTHYFSWLGIIASVIMFHVFITYFVEIEDSTKNKSLGG